MKNPFTEHPHSVGETYFEHMRCAMKFHYTLFKLSMYFSPVIKNLGLFL